MKKRILNVMLVLCMLAAFMPCTVSAYNGTQYGDYLYYMVNDDGTGVTITDCDVNADNVVIPDEIENLPVTAIGNSVFSYQNSLISVYIPNGVESIGNEAFFLCKNLTSVNIPNSVQSIGDYAFNGCANMPSITIPDSVSSIGICTFLRCGGLTSIDIPKSVTSIGDGAFSGCVNLTSINVDSQNPSYSSLDGNLFDKDKKLLIKYAEGKQGSKYSIPDSVTAIGDSAFSNCSSLKGVTIPKGVTLIGENAFYGCSGLTSIDIPSGVTAISDYAFQYCSGLTNVIIPNNVTSIGSHAFYGCAGLKSVDIPNSVTSIGGAAFYDCTVLTSITIPDSVSKIDWATFSGCVGLKSITIPDSITYIGGSAFWHCKSLPNIYIPEGVTYIGEHAFAGCSGLTSINVDGQNPNYKSLDGNLFDKDKKNLMQYAIGKQDRAYNIPEGVTSIDDLAFEGCSSLTSISIPKSITSIGVGAFYDCNSLSDVYYSGNESDWQAIKINHDNDPLKKATIHYNSEMPIDPLKVKPVQPTVNIAANKIEVPVTVVDEAHAEELNEVELYIAEYDENGQFVGLKLGTKGAVEGDTITFTADIPDAEHYKFMLWDANNAPLMDAVTSISE